LASGGEVEELAEVGVARVGGASVVGEAEEEAALAWREEAEVGQ
jgi:hypothetical protein